MITGLVPQTRSDKVIPQPFIDTTGEFERKFEEAKRKEIEERKKQQQASLEKPKNMKRYLLCILFLDNSWDVQEVVGQSTARETLKECVDEIDLDRSFVLVEDVAFGDGKISAYDFLILIEGNYSDGFDVRDHLLHHTKTEEEEEEERNENIYNGDAPETYEKYQMDNVYPTNTKELR